jgi:hypothetical protein
MNINRTMNDCILHYNGHKYIKAMHEAWKSKMLKDKKKLLFKLKLVQRKLKKMKIKGKHRHINDTFEGLIPSKHLKQRKYLQLKRISRLSLLRI